jgi:tetratricopeptide (TPR) repeat protein
VNEEEHVDDPKDNAAGELTEGLEEVARGQGGTLHVYPRPGRAVRRIVLRDQTGERGSQYEDAVLEADGTLRVFGQDQGRGVSEVFGEDITSYDWVYVVGPDRIGNLVRALGGDSGDDVLALLAAYYQRTGGVLSSLLKSVEVAAEFDSWLGEPDDRSTIDVGVRAHRRADQGKRLLAAGRHADALAAIEEAVALYRRLVAVNPAAFESDLAAALDDFGANLAALGRRKEAATCAEEAGALRRRLAAGDL